MVLQSKKILLYTVIPSLIAIAVAIWFFLIAPRITNTISPEGQIEIVTVERLTQNEGIEISGNIEPVNSVDLAFPVAGYIDIVYVNEGDIVESGDILAVLEDSQYRYDLATVDAEIDSEKISGTKRNLNLLALKREMMLSALEDTRLTSVLSGIVTSVEAEAGDYVTAQQAGSANDVVVRIIDRSTMKATVEVDELDAPYLAEGQRTRFYFDAYPELEIYGQVSFVPLEARKTEQGIAVLDTEVAIDDPPAEILPYFTFSGEIFLDNDEEILLLPKAALRSRGEKDMVIKVLSNEESEAILSEQPGGQTHNKTQNMDMSGGFAGINIDLELPQGSTLMPIQVTVEFYNSDMVQVTRGLEAEDKVLVIPATEGSDIEDSESRSIMNLLRRPPGPGTRPPGAGGH